MFDRRDVIYSYDGSLAGFLCCVFESFTKKETPADILNQNVLQPSLLQHYGIIADADKAQRVQQYLQTRMGRATLLFLEQALLTCLPQKELWMLQLIYLGHRQGARVMRMLSHPAVNTLNKAVQQLTHEAHLYSGFVRFSLHGNLMLASLKPKNSVLPLLGPHFEQRFPNEKFLLYDETHRMVYAYARGQAVLSSEVTLTFPPPDAAEMAYRKLWRMFYDTIAVEGRENHRCRMTHMPKRYWDRMTEFKTEPAENKTAPKQSPVPALIFDNILK